MHTSSSALSLNDVNLESVSIYKTDNTNLRIAGLQNKIANIKIFSVLGKQVLNTTFNSNKRKDISLPKLSTGVYLVILQTDNGRLTKKVILD